MTFPAPVQTSSGMLEELTVVGAGCEPVPDYAGDPNAWLGAATGEYAWGKQREIWQSVHENRATAVLSCNNSGKTWLAARIAVWWILTYWRQGVRLVTTAPTAAQVQLLLWQEVRNAYESAKARGVIPPPGRIVASPYPQWKIGHRTVGFGRKPADHQQSAMQGVHARYVLAIVDEAGGVAQSIFNALDKITTNEHARVLAIGNPDDITTPFGKITKAGSGWQVIHVDGLRTPNMTREAVESGRYPLLHAMMKHEGIPYSTEPIPEEIRGNLLSPLFVEERFTRYCGVSPETVNRMGFAELGRYVSDQAAQSQLFSAVVRGQFPEGSGDSVIPIGWVHRAQERWSDWNMGDERRGIAPRSLEGVPGRRIVGVDVATTNGADETCLSPRQGRITLGVHRYSEGDTHVTAGHVLEHTGPVFGAALAVVDGIGIGAGVRDVLRNQYGLATVSFEAYLQSGRRDRWGQYGFNNDRSAAWWRMRELLDPVHGAGIMLPPDEHLEEELTAPKWRVTSSTSGGIIRVESKDEIRKRLDGRSTDSADAVIQSYWVDGPPPQTQRAEGTAAIPWSGSRPGTPAGAALDGMIPYNLGSDEDED